MPRALLPLARHGGIYTRTQQLMFNAVSIDALIEIIHENNFKMFDVYRQPLIALSRAGWSGTLLAIAELLGATGNITFVSMLGSGWITNSIYHAIMYMHRDYVFHFKHYTNLNDPKYASAALRFGTPEYLEFIHTTCEFRAVVWEERMGTYIHRKNWEQLAWILCKIHAAGGYRVPSMVLQQLSEAELQVVCEMLPDNVREWYMNDGKQDRMLNAIALLDRRLARLERARARRDGNSEDES